MTTFCGFDLEKVQALQKALSSSPTAASSLSGDITNAARRAEWISVSAAGLSPHNLGIDREPTTAPAGLTAVATDAGDVAAEVQRRLDHLKSCQDLVKLGLRITPEEAFEDLPAIDAAKVKKAFDDLGGALDGKDVLGVLKASGAIHDLNAGETDALLAQLSDTQLGSWNSLLGVTLPGPLGSVMKQLRAQLGNDLFTRLGEEQRKRITALMASLQPPLDDDHKGHPLGELPVADIDAATLEDINQGEIGDCWFLASIGAELTADPDFVKKHMVANPNGTYTVTFYKDGKPVQVTVDSKVPIDGSSSEFAHGDPGWGTQGPSWVAIYEKAFAQFKGGYGETEGGFGDEGMEALTGRDADRKDPDDLSFSDIQHNLDAGVPMTAGTKDHTTGHLWWTKHQEKVDVGDDTIVSLHEYTVVGVDNDAHPPTVKLRNPWGSAGSADEFVTLTEDEFHDNYNELSVG